jgi:hypothetical protein
MKFSLDKAKDFISDLGEDIGEQFDKNITANLKEFGAEKLNDIWDGINSSSTVLLKAGYTITEITMSLGLPPTINIAFSKVHEVNIDEIKRLMISNKNNKVLFIILGAMIKAEELQTAMKSGVYAFTGLSIKVGASIPEIDMKFKKAVVDHTEL